MPVTVPYPAIVAGIQVHPLRQQDLLAWIEQTIDAGQRVAVLYANAHAINMAQKNARFCQAMNVADVVFCDGHGVRLAARALGYPMPERFTPPDWIDQLAALARQRRYRIFLLGSELTVVTHAAEHLRTRFPDIEVVVHHGYFDHAGSENNTVRHLINQADPDILLVGMGMPLQEIWITDNLPHLSVHMAMSVGALFEYLTGHVTRGPRWLTNNGFEWLCRLWFEPKRLWRRYILGNPYFIWLVLQQLIRQRLARRRIR